MKIWFLCTIPAVLNWTGWDNKGHWIFRNCLVSCCRIIYMCTCHVCGCVDTCIYMYMKKAPSWWGQTSQQSLDGECFEPVSSHQQGRCTTFLAHHPALYTCTCTCMCGSWHVLLLCSVQYSLVLKYCRYTVHVYAFAVNKTWSRFWRTMASRMSPSRVWLVYLVSDDL